MDVRESIGSDYRWLAARYLRKQAKRLAAQLEGARGAADPESIHQARVASRRMRAAMRVFDGCFDAEQAARWTKEIRRITSRLGDARDADVQSAFLCDVMASIEQRACFAGLALLLAKLQKRRDRQQPQVIRAVDRIGASGVLKEIRAVTKEMLADAGPGPKGQGSGVSRERARRHVVERVAELRSHEACLTDPSDHARHHAMRIAAKRLRYTMEIVSPVFAGRLSKPIGAVKRVQTFLGEIHDCDVWVDRLAEFGARERSRIEESYGPDGPQARHLAGLEFLQARQRQVREREFGELVKFWQELADTRFWENLEASIGETQPQADEGKRQGEHVGGTACDQDAANDGPCGARLGAVTLHGPHPTTGPSDGPVSQPPIVARPSGRTGGGV